MSAHPNQDLYDRIPAMECRGFCGGANPMRRTCCGPIGCSKVEAQLLDAYNGKATAWAEIGPGAVTMEVAKLGRDMQCPHLGMDHRCEAYAVRPAICRLWGAVEAMACPWGCRPARWLSPVESTRILKEAARRALVVENPCRAEPSRG